ncbi:MAG TPA: PhzF family phenazine biosynthesis protein [Candidatus Saccharimonadales bacterium]|nr:PhzF family phenazine biosynthesis protein [Candidatus Saccharimonadales bacterium]
MTKERRYSYVLLDVFTHNALEGNQLAVFTDARGLSDSEMQALAKETNLSETTFILPRDAEEEREKGVRVRIFTTQEELPFAGHPTLGTAWVLGQQRAEAHVDLDLNVGKIPVRFTANDRGQLVGEMRQRDPEFGETYRPELIAQATGVPLNFFDTALPIQTVSTGTPFIIVPLKSLRFMRELRVDQKSASAFTREHDGKFFYFVTRETETPGATLHARMQFYNGEDSATGSAAGCCAAWSVQYDVLGSEVQGLIEQGLEMGRPSFIRIQGRKTELGITDIRVGGEVVEVARGEFVLR